MLVDWIGPDRTHFGTWIYIYIVLCIIILCVVYFCHVHVYFFHFYSFYHCIIYQACGAQNTTTSHQIWIHLLETTTHEKEIKMEQSETIKKKTATITPVTLLHPLLLQPQSSLPYKNYHTINNPYNLHTEREFQSSQIWYSYQMYVMSLTLVICLITKTSMKYSNREYYLYSDDHS